MPPEPAGGPERADGRAAERQAAEQRAHHLAGVVWHTGAFVIVNAFFWLLDLATDGGLTWAWWITLFWGFALAFHWLAWFVDGRQLEARKAAEYLERSRARGRRPDRG